MIARSLPILLFLASTPAPAGDLRIPVPGRVRDLYRIQPDELQTAAPGGAPLHYLVKLSGRIELRTLRSMRNAGLLFETRLSADSAVVRSDGVSPGACPEVSWFSLLSPEDKAPPELLAAPRSGAILSALGHPGSTFGRLRDEAERAGLRVLGGFDSPSGGRVEIAQGSSLSALRHFLAEDDVFAVLPRPRQRLANDLSIGTIQSGVQNGPTPMFDHGIYGVGQIIGYIDTGLDVDSCYFADPTGAPFAVNTYSAAAGYGTDVGSAHRKIAAYDFEHSCDQFPAPCDVPDNPLDYDDEGHGTHVAGNAAGDNFAHLLIHDSGDGMAPGARLIVQDGGYDASNGPCGDLPGLGCAPGGVTPLLSQAYAQGAKIHNDSWADDPLGPPPANAGYSLSARDVDDFVFQHPDFLPFFVAGNAGALGARSIPSPGNGKNVVCVGSTRNSATGSDENLSDFSGVGPAADGRLKPDLVAPGFNISASSDFTIASGNCGQAAGAGTSYAAPTAAGAGALVRDYFAQGFYPGGVADAANAFSASAALVKAALIASAVPIHGARLGVPVTPPPSNEQGFGRINLSHVLPFQSSDFQLLAADRAEAFASGDTDPVSFAVTVASSSQPLRVVLAWMDPPGVPRAYDDSTPELVDDLDLVVTGPDGKSISPSDHINTVELVSIDTPSPGLFTISVVPNDVAPGPAVGFALVATGDFTVATGSGLSIDPGSARLDVDPNGSGTVDDCETLSGSVAIVNASAASSASATVKIEPLDSAVELTSPAPVDLASIPPSGVLRVGFMFRAGFDGIPLLCGQTVPFRVTLLSSDGYSTSTVISFPAAAQGAGCGDVASLTCAPLQIRPIRPR